MVATKRRTTVDRNVLTNLRQREEEAKQEAARLREEVEQLRASGGAQRDPGPVLDPNEVGKYACPSCKGTGITMSIDQTSQRVRREACRECMVSPGEQGYQDNVVICRGVVECTRAQAIEHELLPATICKRCGNWFLFGGGNKGRCPNQHQGLNEKDGSHCHWNDRGVMGQLLPIRSAS